MGGQRCFGERWPCILRRRRARQVSEAYARAYGQGEGLGDEFAGWEHEGVWPET